MVLHSFDKMFSNLSNPLLFIHEFSLLNVFLDVLLLKLSQLFRPGQVAVYWGGGGVKDHRIVCESRRKWLILLGFVILAKEVQN